MDIRKFLNKVLSLLIRHPLNYCRVSRLSLESVIALSMVQSIQLLHGATKRKSSFYFAPLLDSDTFLNFLKNKNAYYSKLDKNLAVKRMKRLEAKGNTKSLKPNELTNSSRNLLIISDNWNFLQSAIEGMQIDYGIQVRTFDYSMLRKSKYYNFNSTILRKSRWYYSSKLAQKAIDDTLILRQLLESCDTVLVEWGSDAARFFSHHLGEEKTLVVRIHSYEAFTPLSYFMNFSRINQLIFVAPHIENLMEILHRRRIEDIPKCVVPNVRSLKFTTKDSAKNRELTLGMAGYSNQNKNPKLALEIIKKLRDGGLSIPIRFCGTPWPDQGLKHSEEVYRREFFSYLAENNLEHLVTFDPFIDDMTKWFENVDIMLSCSFREGTHEVIVEGAALGCVPLIRDWPMVKNIGGARTVFSDFNDLIFDEVEEAVDLIKMIIKNFDNLSSRSSEIAKRKFDITKTLPDFVLACFPGRDLENK